LKSENLLEPLGLVQACNGIPFLRLSNRVRDGFYEPQAMYLSTRKVYEVFGLHYNSRFLCFMTGQTAVDFRKTHSCLSYTDLQFWFSNSTEKHRVFISPEFDMWVLKNAEVVTGASKTECSYFSKIC